MFILAAYPPLHLTATKFSEEPINHPHRRGERFIKNWRALVSLLVVARRLRTFAYANSAFERVLDDGPITAQEPQDAWDLIAANQQVYENRKHKVRHAVAICEAAATEWGIDGVQVVGKRQVAAATQAATKYTRLPSAEFLEAVHASLPSQPWKPGIHKQVATTLKQDVGEVRIAIQLLIEQGRRNRQVDGVVYGQDGSVLAINQERLESE